MNWMDISMPLTNDISHWPGDVPFEFGLSASKEQTGSVNVGRISTSVHIGTHIDAPFHFDNGGKKVHDLDVNIYIGTALIADMRGSSTIGRKELEQVDLKGARRLILRTREASSPKSFPVNPPYIRPDAGPWLKEKGVVLLGVDVPSVDELSSKTMDSHHSLHENGVCILENLRLDEVHPGLYELIALPLPLYGADGSPVRAVVRPYTPGKSVNL